MTSDEPRRNLLPVSPHADEGHRVVIDPDLLDEARDGLITNWDDVPDSLKAKIGDRTAGSKQPQS